MSEEKITYITKNGKIRTRRPRPPSLTAQINCLTHKVMKKMGESLDSASGNNSQQALAGYNSMISTLNTLAELLLKLELQKRAGKEKKTEGMLPVSESDMQLIERFITKQKPQAE